jgi:hypothetical protein
VRLSTDPNVQAMADHMITHEYNMSQGVETCAAARSKQAAKISLCLPPVELPRPWPGAAPLRVDPSPRSGRR